MVSITQFLSEKVWILTWILGLLCLTTEESSCFRNNCRSGSCGLDTLLNSSFSGALRTLLSDYDSALRPTQSQGVPTNVSCDVYINSFDSISVDTMDYSVNIYIRQTWVDPRLTYTEKFPNVSRITVDQRIFEHVWVPDVFFPNEKASTTHCVTVPNSMIRIYPNGSILYSARYTLTMSCYMKLRKYPFDRQECMMKLESFSYSTDEMQLLWLDQEAVQINENLELPQFDLISFKTSRCTHSYITGDYSCLEIRFRLQRQYGYYMIQTYVPSILIVTLSWVAFWINIDAVPARISLGVLTVLTLTTQCVGVWMSLPRVSYVKAIDVWMSACIVSVFAAMLEFALVNTLARKEIRRLSIRARANEKYNANSAMSSDMMKRVIDEYAYGVPQKYDPNSRMLARKVDKVSRWLFPSAFMVFNIAYWCCYLL